MAEVSTALWGAVPILGGLFSALAAGKAKQPTGSQTTLSPEQQKIWNEILIPELMQRYSSYGKFNPQQRNLYLSDILGGVNDGYSGNVEAVNGLNIDPATRKSLLFQVDRDKAKNTAAGYRSLVDMENQRYDDTFNIAQGLGTTKTTQFNPYPQDPGGAAMWGNLSNTLGYLGGNMMGYNGNYFKDKMGINFG